MNPIQNEPALYMKKEKALVIADVHIGIEYDLYERGVSIGSKTDILIKRLKGLLSRLDVEKLIVVGDLKHVIPNSPPSQRRDLERFADVISRYADILLLPGNHDGNIAEIIGDRIKILPSSGFILGDVGFFHGHRWPNENVIKSRIVVAAHSHPSMIFKDRFGYRFMERCWVIAKPNYNLLKERYRYVNVERIIVIPAFNPLCGGIPVNEDGFIGIIDKVIDKDSIEIYLLDGTYIGNPNR